MWRRDRGARPVAAAHVRAIRYAAVRLGYEDDVRSLSSPRWIGPYEIVRPIGAGGMATLYLALAPAIGGHRRRVAVKVLHPHLGRLESFTAMFHDEARIASRIVHPNVCRIYEFGEARGTHYLVMDFLEGAPLVRVLKKLAGARDLRESAAEHRARIGFVVTSVLDACEGLHAAHELVDDDGRLLNVIHRDVSPDNMFVTLAGNTCVLDFGIASARDRLTETRTGEVKGKLSYMAPEVVAAEPYDRRVDVWALGVVLFEGIALRRLFRRANDAATLHAVLHDEVPPLAGGPSDLPPALDAVLSRALDRDPSARFATARELGDALRVACDGYVVPPSRMADALVSILPDVREPTISIAHGARRESEPPPTQTDARGQITQSAALASEVRTRPLSLPPPTRTPRIPWGALAIVIVAGVAGIAGAWVAVSSSDWRAPASSRGAVTLPTEREQAVTVAALVFDAGSSRDAGAARMPDAGVTVDAGADAGPPVVARARHDRARSEGPMSAPEPARVTILTTTGWAAVRHEGRNLGNTPLRVELPSGARELELLPYGRGPSIRRRVEIVAGRNNTIRVPLP
jgi:serine/threonine protein kinase